MQARTNLKTRKEHLKKALVPTDLCCGCRSVSDRQIEEAWNPSLALSVHTEVLYYFPKPLKIQYIGFFRK